MAKIKKNIGINATLSVIKQSMAFIFPLITYPYVSRVLGAESLGKVSFATSIIGYFSMFALLGTSTYAVREGAKYKYDKAAFSRFADEILTINIIFTIAAYVLLLLAAFCIPKLVAYRWLLIIQSANILIMVVNVDWINVIYEDFWLQTLRTIICYVLTLILLFVFIHKSSDYYLYAAMLVLAAIPPCILNVIHCRKYVHLRLTKKPNMSAHMKPLLILFSNQIAISIYTNLDMTMLGLVKTDTDVGIYSMAVKIYTILKNMMAAIYTVAIPRLAVYAGGKKWKDYKSLYTDLIGYLSLILVPVVFGIICVAREIILLIGDTEFIDATLPLKILAVALLFAIFGGLLTACLNVTIGREADNLKATVIGAILNFVLNLVFIPLFSYNGAAITTLLSELFVMVYCFIRIPDKEKYMDLRKIFKTIVHCVLASAAMLIYSICIYSFVSSMIMRLIAIIPVCIVIYIVLLAVMRDEYFINAYHILMNKVKKK